MVWCGVVGCGVMWCSVVWFGVMYFDVVFCGENRFTIFFKSLFNVNNTNRHFFVFFSKSLVFRIQFSFEVKKTKNSLNFRFIAVC